MLTGTDLVRATLEWFEHPKHHHTQHAFQRVGTGGEACACVGGAAMACVGYRTSGEFPLDAPEDVELDIIPTMDDLAASLGFADRHQMYDWNDVEGRTQGEVEALLRRKLDGGSDA